MTYSLKSTAHPTFSSLTEVPTYMTLAIALTGIFVAIYALVYVAMLFAVLVKCGKIPMRQRVTCIINLILLGITIGTLFGGTFTSLYNSGGSFVFFLFIYNLYIIVLLYLHWPIEEEASAMEIGEVEMKAGEYSNCGPENFQPLGVAEDGPAHASPKPQHTSQSDGSKKAVQTHDVRIDF